MSLLLWMPFTDGTPKQQGLKTIEFSGTAPVSNDAGKLGKCGYCTQTYYNDNFTDLSSGIYSIAYWVKYTSFPTNNEYVVCINGTTSSDMLISLGVQNNDGKLSVRAGASGTTLSLNTWYHIAYVANGSSSILYLNGVPIKTYNTVGNTSASHLTINGRYGSRPIHNFYLNDLRIYDHALSAKEVEEIAKGLVLHYKLDNNGCGNANLIQDSTSNWTQISSQGSYIIMRSSTTNFGLAANEQYTFSFDLQVPTNQKKGRARVEFWNSGSDRTGPTSSIAIINGEGRTSVSGTVLSGYTEMRLVVDWNASVDINTTNIPCYYKNIKLERGNKATTYCPYDNSGLVYDSSGYGNNGTITGSLTTATPSPRYSVATHFECSAPTVSNNTGLTYIKSNFGLTTPVQMSICWWAHPESGYNDLTANAAWCTSISASYPADYNYTAFHHRDGKFDICLNSDSTTSKYLSVPSYTKNEWHHYSVIYNGTIAILYQDGIEVSRSTISSTTAPLKTFTYLYIGFSYAGSVWRKTLGSYSDFRIYTTALTEAQIKELYNTSMSIDNNGNIHARELVEL